MKSEEKGWKDLVQPPHFTSKDNETWIGPTAQQRELIYKEIFIPYHKLFLFAVESSNLT